MRNYNFSPLREVAPATHAVRHTTEWVLPLSLRQRSLRPTLRKLHSVFVIQNIYNFLLFLRAQSHILAAIDWHSFSQLILRPYGMMCSYNYTCTNLSSLYTGWTRSFCPDEEQLKAIGDKMSSDIFSVSTFLKMWNLMLYVIRRFMAWDIHQKQFLISTLLLVEPQTGNALRLCYVIMISAMFCDCYRWFIMTLILHDCGCIITQVLWWRSYKHQWRLQGRWLHHWVERHWSIWISTSTGSSMS